MLLKIKYRLYSTHDDQGGQTLIFIAIVMFALVCFFALVVNVGDRISAKVEMQNAADAAVMAGGIWNARGMNMISILNVGMTECLAFIIFFKAFDKTYIATEVAIEANILAAEGMKAIGEALVAAYGIGTIIIAAAEAWKVCLDIVKQVSLKIAEEMNNLMKKLADKDNSISLWKMMKLLQTFESIIKYSTPVIAAYEANHIAELNGADRLPGFPPGIEYAGMLFPTDPIAGLPVKKGVFKDLCPPTTSGGPGYTNFLCWDSALGIEDPIIGIKIRHFFTAGWTFGFL